MFVVTRIAVDYMGSIKNSVSIIEANKSVIRQYTSKLEALSEAHSGLYSSVESGMDSKYSAIENWIDESEERRQEALDKINRMEEMVQALLEDERQSEEEGQAVDHSAEIEVLEKKIAA